MLIYPHNANLYMNYNQFYYIFLSKMKGCLAISLLVIFLLTLTHQRVLQHIRTDLYPQTKQEVKIQTDDFQVQKHFEESDQNSGSNLDRKKQDKEISDISEPYIKIPDFDISIESIKKKLPDIQIDIPKPNIDYDDLKLKFDFFISAVIQGLIYIGIGAGIGTLLPLVIFLTIYLIGLTIFGFITCSFVACCRSPKFILTKFFSLHSVQAIKKVFLFCPYTAGLGVITGLASYIGVKMFQWQINIDFQHIRSTILRSMEIGLGAVTDLGIGTAIGAFAPIALCVCAIGLQLAFGSLNACLQSPTSIISIIQLIRKARKCIKLIPSTSVLGGMSGLVYFSLLE